MSALTTRRLPLAALFLAILGCTRELPLALPPDKPAQVSEFGGRPRTLEPASEDYHALQGWVSGNRAGWSWGRYYTAPPQKGILVRAGALNLQFFESTVLARTPDGDYVKQLPPADYAVLERIARGD